MALLLHGGCRCGAVRFEIGDVFDAGYCHCRRCRRRSGAPVFAFAHVPRAAFKLTGGALVAEAKERLGQEMVCSQCRGSVCYDMGERNLISVGIGLLDEPERVRPTFHQWVASKLAWLELSDDLPRFSDNTISHPRERLSPIAPE